MNQIKTSSARKTCLFLYSPVSERLVFFEIELTDATVQDMSLGANDALGQTAEEVSFNFQKIKLTDTIIDEPVNREVRSS